MNQAWEMAYIMAYCVHGSAPKAAAVAKDAIDSMKEQRTILEAERRRLAEERVLRCPQRSGHDQLLYTIEKCRGGCGLTGKETYTEYSWCKRAGTVAPGDPW